MSIHWFDRFLKLYFDGDYEKAYQFKHANIPSKLYRFQPLEENRIATVINNQLWFNLPKDMNDPFDSRGLCWDSKEIEDSLRELSEDIFIRYDSANDVIDGMISSFRDNIRITCFSEELYSMPMWSHYANNHTGFCIEYDFSNLDYDNIFAKNLFPVWYEPQKYNITNLFKIVSKDMNDRRMKLFFFLLNMKHNSWSYEKEWRIISLREQTQDPLTGGLESCPIRPAAIYLGTNFDEESMIHAIEKFRNTNIPMFKLEPSNSEFFDMNLKKL